MTVADRDAEAGGRRLAGISILERARRLDLVQVLRESLDLGVELGRTVLRRFGLVDVLKEDVPGHVILSCVQLGACHPYDEWPSGDSTT